MMELKAEKQRISVNNRIEALERAKALSYPRIGQDAEALTLKEFAEQYSTLEANNILHDDSRTIRGMVESLIKSTS